jgi:lysophospholipase L1-like esterase
MQQFVKMGFYKKIFLIGISFVLMYSADALSQNKISWDSTSRPAVYSPLVGQFRAFPPGKKDIVFLGNSITFWGDWGERFKKLKIKNQGIPGDITFGVLDRIHEVISGKPSKVFILIGINDIARHIPDSVIIRNYIRIIDRIRAGSPATKIFFQTLLPTNASFHALTSHYHKEKDILEINAALRKIASEKKIGLIDLYAHFADASGNLIKDYSWDGVHLTQKGYAQWVKILKEGHYLK